MGTLTLVFEVWGQVASASLKLHLNNKSNVMSTKMRIEATIHGTGSCFGSGDALCDQRVLGHDNCRLSSLTALTLMSRNYTLGRSSSHDKSLIQAEGVHVAVVCLCLF